MFKKTKEMLSMISMFDNAVHHMDRLSKRFTQKAKSTWDAHTEQKIKCYHVDPTAPFFMPKRANNTDAAYDVHSVEDKVIPRGKHAIVRLNLRIETPEGWQVRVLGRSGLGTKGIQIHQGVVDYGYGREICVVVYNINYTNPESPKNMFTIAKGDRIAQIQARRLDNYDFSYEDFSTEDSREGLGSTGSRPM